MARAPNSVDLALQRTGVSVGGSGSRNAALDLAQALAQASPQTDRLFAGIQERAKVEAATAAKRDALSNSGVAYADAVRSGRIKPVSSPWYIQQYNQQAAQVRAQGATAKLAAEAQLWPEKGDPVAFANRFNKEMGQLAKGFAGVDAQVGFQTAASPILQQELARNVAFNSQRIVEQHTQDAGSLLTQTVIDTNKANAGNATPAQLWDAIEKNRQEWVATGGTEVDFDKMTINAITAAGYQTDDADLLENLSDDRGGRGALGNIVGPDGQPVAANISQAQFRIQQAADFRATSETRRVRSQVELEGTKAYQAASNHFGYDFIARKVDGATVAKYLQDQGVPAPAASYALRQFAEDAAGINSLNSNLYAANGDKIMTMYDRALKVGYSTDLRDDVFEAVRTNVMPYNEGQQILSQANSTSRQAEAEGKADAREARAAAKAANANNVDTARELSAVRKQASALVAYTVTLQGDRYYDTASNRTQMDKRAADAEGAWLATHPGDYAGASLAAKQVYNNYLNWRLGQRKKPTKAGPSGAAAKDNR